MKYEGMKWMADDSFRAGPYRIAKYDTFILEKFVDEENQFDSYYIARPIDGGDRISIPENLVSNYGLISKAGK